MDTLFAGLRRRAFAADPDDALLARFTTTGDEAAFAELVRRHGPTVYAAARRRLPDPADAADVFQATFLLLVRKARRLAGRPTLGPWLYRTAALTARNLRRKNARRPGRLPDPVAPALDPTLGWDLDDALLALPERDRAAVVLCHLLGHSRQEAAERLGLPEGTLSAVLHRALRRLRVRLDRDPRPLLAVAGVTLPAGLASAAGRTATAVWAAGLSAASPGVATLAGGWSLKPLAVGGLLAVAGLGVGFALRPAPTPVAATPAEPRAGIRLTAAGITWVEARLQVPVRTADDLRPLLDRFRRDAGPARRLDLTADPDVPTDTLLAVARVCVAAGFPGVQYAGPTPGFSASLGTETHDWGRGQLLAEPTPVDLPTAFGLHLRADTPEARAVAFVVRRQGVVTRDDTRPGRPVVAVALTGPLTDSELQELLPLAELATLRLDGTGVTDAGLPTLARFPQLTSLDLSGTAVTPAGVELLRRALPGCIVQR
jgi:RNA polymerase sigma factor (sigma-70 family)